MPTMSAVAFGANRVALKSGVRARPAARRTAVAVHAAKPRRDVELRGPRGQPQPIHEESRAHGKPQAGDGAEHEQHERQRGQARL